MSGSIPQTTSCSASVRLLAVCPSMISTRFLAILSADSSGDVESRRASCLTTMEKWKTLPCPATPELASAFPVNACVVGVPPPCGHCADGVRHALEAGAARDIAGDANVQRLLGLFRDGPWIEAEVMVPGAPFGPDQQMFAVVNGEEVLEVGVGWPPPGRPRTVWIPARKAITGKWHSVGFLAARNRQEAREKARGSADLKRLGNVGSLETFRFDCRCVLPPGWRAGDPMY